MMSNVLEREMWRVAVVSSDGDRQPVQDFHYFWSEKEAEEYFKNKTAECFNDPNMYCYALHPVKVR